MEVRAELTEREKVVLKLLAVDCLSVRGAAEHLGKNDRTIESHKFSAMRKLDVHRMAQLVRIVMNDPSIVSQAAEPTEEEKEDFPGVGPKLTGRETQVLALVLEGKRNREIGKVLGIVEGTVKIYMKQLFDKRPLCKNRIELKARIRKPKPPEAISA